MNIRKIAIGPDYKGGAMHYLMGQKVLDSTHEIHLIKFNALKNSFEVYVINSNQEVFLWKEFTQTMPIVVEYNINF
jgi:hypothetical protein